MPLLFSLHRCDRGAASSQHGNGLVHHSASTEKCLWRCWVIWLICVSMDATQQEKPQHANLQASVPALPEKRENHQPKRKIKTGGGRLSRGNPQKRRHASRPLSHFPCVLPLPLLFQIYTDSINYVHHHWGLHRVGEGPWVLGLRISAFYPL